MTSSLDDNMVNIYLHFWHHHDIWCCF